MSTIHQKLHFPVILLTKERLSWSVIFVNSVAEISLLYITIHFFSLLMTVGLQAKDIYETNQTENVN